MHRFVEGTRPTQNKLITKRGDVLEKLVKTLVKHVAKGLKCKQIAKLLQKGA